MPQKPFVICCLPDPPIDLGIASLKINESIVLGTNSNGSTVISKIPTQFTGMFNDEGALRAVPSLGDMINSSLTNASTASMEGLAK